MTDKPFRTFLCSTLVCFFSLYYSLAHSANKTPNQISTKQPEIKRFISQMVKEYGFKQQKLEKLFNHIPVRQDVIDKMNTPYESKPWYLYRKHFLTKKRINKGDRFWQKHHKNLQRAEKQFGVPAKIIVAIIGVETHYGKFLGKYSVLESLSTLAFYYPARATFFREELKQFLLLAREIHLNPRKALGSYAGAMGQPQFIPSSYRNYAVDFSGNGKKDLWRDTADIIGSIANYLSKNNWQKGQPITERARIAGKKYQRALKQGLKPKYSLSQLAKYGIKPSYRHKSALPASLLGFEQKKRTDYWLGFNNFYVITRYNTSPLYAMAVFQLGEKIAALRTKRLAKKLAHHRRYRNKHQHHRRHGTNVHRRLHKHQPPHTSTVMCMHVYTYIP